MRNFIHKFLFSSWFWAAIPSLLISYFIHDIGKHFSVEIEKKYNQDTASSISNLIDELNIRLSAYEFDKKYEKDR